jgi:glycosyltransferase involved in cell wall biosynthesis
MWESPDAPLVSVVITTYYRNETLSAAIDSVLDQSYDPVELIVVDDSGEAHAASVAADRSGVEYIALDENRGMNAARTIGVKRADGEYIHFLDDDDWMYESKLAHQVATIARREESGVVYTGLNEAGTVYLPTPTVRGDVLQEALCLDMWPCMTSTMLIDKDVVADVVPFSERPAATDLEYMIQFARRTEFEYIDAPLLYKRVEEDSVGRSPQAIECRKELIDDYTDLYAAQPSWVRRRALANTYETSGELTIMKNGWSVAAVASYAKHLYYEPREKSKSVVKLGGALFGRPGLRLLRHIASHLSGE